MADYGDEGGNPVRYEDDGDDYGDENRNVRPPARDYNRGGQRDYGDENDGYQRG